MLNLEILWETTSNVVKAITKGASAPVPLAQPRLGGHRPAIASIFMGLMGDQVYPVVIFLRPNTVQAEIVTKQPENHGSVFLFMLHPAGSSHEVETTPATPVSKKLVFVPRGLSWQIWSRANKRGEPLAAIGEQEAPKEEWELALNNPMGGGVEGGMLMQSSGDTQDANCHHEQSNVSHSWQSEASEWKRSWVTIRAELLEFEDEGKLLEVTQITEASAATGSHRSHVRKSAHTLPLWLTIGHSSILVSCI